MLVDEYDQLFYKSPDQIIRDENSHLEAFILMNLNSGDKVLDIGCGSGYWLKIANSMQHNSIGIDIAIDRLKFINQCSESTVVVSSANNLPFKENYFDAVFLFWVVQEILDESILLEVVQEIRRVTKDQGSLIVAENNTGQALIYAKNSDFGIMHKGCLERRILRLFPTNTLASLLNQFGFFMINHESIEDSFFERYLLTK